MNARKIIAALASIAAASALAVDVYLGAWGGVGTWSGSGADRYWAYGVPYEWNTNDFVLVWNVPDTNAVAIPCRSGYTYNCTIFWGDLTSSEITAYNDADLSHSYAAAGTYTVAITGSFPTIYFNNGGAKLLVTQVTNFGNVGWANWDSAFYGCTNVTAALGPSTGVTNLYQAYRDCKRMTVAPDVSAHTNNTSLYAAFYNCLAMKNAPDVSAHTLNTSLYYAFYNCYAMKNAPDVSAHTLNTRLDWAFYNCSAMTNAPDVSAHTLNTRLDQAFRNCTAMKNAPDVSAHTLNTTLEGAFAYCSAMTNAPDVSAHTLNTSLASAFANCTAMTNAPDVSAHTLNTTLYYAFQKCSAMTNLPSMSIGPRVTTARYCFDGNTKMAGDLATQVANYGVSNLYLGCQNCDALTYSTAGGMLSSNIAHGFNLDFSLATLDSNEVAYILQDLDTSAATGGVVNVSGGANEKPTYDGYVAATNLTGKGWTVTLP